MGYVVGGAILFGIGFITYEIVEGFKQAASEIAHPVTSAYDSAQTAYAPYATTVDDATLLALASNPVTLPAAVAYEIYEAI